VLAANLTALSATVLILGTHPGRPVPADAAYSAAALVSTAVVTRRCL
jgi:hypothetical protein